MSYTEKDFCQCAECLNSAKPTPREADTLDLEGRIRRHYTSSTDWEWIEFLLKEIDRLRASSPACKICPHCTGHHCDVCGYPVSKGAAYCQIHAAPAPLGPSMAMREELARHLWTRQLLGTDIEGSWALSKTTQAHFYGEADRILSIVFADRAPAPLGLEGLDSLAVARDIVGDIHSENESHWGELNPNWIRVQTRTALKFLDSALETRNASVRALPEPSNPSPS